MSYDNDNIFAKIIRGELPCYKVYEDEKTLSFMDIFPQVRGHTLILPKNSGIDLLNTDDEDVIAAMLTTKKVALAVDKVLKPGGIMIAQLNRALAGQTVFHTHIHILPRWEGLEFQPHGGTPGDKEELEALAKDISAAIE